MEFATPKHVDVDLEVEITVDDVESEIEHLKPRLILFVVGKDLSMNAMIKFIAKV